MRILSLLDILKMALISTNENIHFLLAEPIVLESSEDQGLSSLQKPRLKEIWENQIEGIIIFKLEGSNEEFDLSDYPEYLPQIVEKLSDYMYP